MAIGTLGVLAWGIETNTDEQALTLAFTTFVLFQVFNVFNARSEHRSAFTRDSLRNAKLWAALAAVIVLQILAVHFEPVQALFGTDALTLSDWTLAIVVASSVLWLEELGKLLAHSRG